MVAINKSVNGVFSTVLLKGGALYLPSSVFALIRGGTHIHKWNKHLTTAMKSTGKKKLLNSTDPLQYPLHFPYCSCRVGTKGAMFREIGRCLLSSYYSPVKNKAIMHTSQFLQIIRTVNLLVNSLYRIRNRFRYSTLGSASPL